MTPVRERGRAWWSDEGVAADLDVGLATAPGILIEAARLVQEQYARRGYVGPGPSEWHLGLHVLVPSSQVFVARAGARVVGTVSFLEDSPLGLPLDEAYPEALGRLRARGRRLGQASALAVKAGQGTRGPAIIIRLFRLVLLYAAVVARLDDLCFAVSPHHLGFYRRRVPVRTLGPETPYRPINGAPVVGILVELDLIRALLRVGRAGLSVGRFYDFLFGSEPSRETLTRLRRDLPGSALARWQWAQGVGRPEASAAEPPAIVPPAWTAEGLLAPPNPRPGGRA